MTLNKLLFVIALSLTISACSNDSDTDDLLHENHPLFAAIELGNLEQVKQHLSPESVNLADDCEWTPLMKAALDGHAQIVSLLLSAGASVDLADSGDYTALLLAASNNHVAVVEKLLEHDAQINHQEQTKGWSALIWSAKRGHLETVKLLLRHGADKTLQDFEGKTANDWAIANKHTKVSQLLQ